MISSSQNKWITRIWLSALFTECLISKQVVLEVSTTFRALQTCFPQEALLHSHRSYSTCPETTCSSPTAAPWIVPHEAMGKRRWLWWLSAWQGRVQPRWHRQARQTAVLPRGVTNQQTRSDAPSANAQHGGDFTNGGQGPLQAMWEESRIM